MMTPNTVRALCFWLALMSIGAGVGVLAEEIRKDTIWHTWKETHCAMTGKHGGQPVFACDDGLTYRQGLKGE